MISPRFSFVPRSPLRISTLAAAIWLVVGEVGLGLINPKVQPRHFFQDYNMVGTLEVEAVETRGALRAELKILETHKGQFPAERVVLTSEDRALLGEFLALTKGSQVVAFAGKDRPRSARNDGIYYAGGGKWYRFRMTEEPGVWEMTGDADKGLDTGSADIMFGVFNGAVEQLARMAADFARERAYFPAVPFTRFEAEMIAKVDGPVHGVGLHDLTGDGKLEAIAASPSGLRVFGPGKDGTFADITSQLGLDGASGVSVDAASVKGDGRNDLLVDGVLYRQGEDGTFRKTEALPTFKDVLSAAFVDFDADGLPDVVVSRRDGGLSAFRNVSEGGEVRFEDATAALGLDAEEAGAGLTGYFDAGDWDGDGRVDLLYLAGPGFLLLNTDKGFRSEPLGAEGEEPDFGAPAMGFLIKPGRMAAVVPDSETKRLLDSAGDSFRDVTRFGNEIQDDVPGLFAALAADLNADGNPDLFFTNRSPGSPSFYVDNRGYGSFMTPDKYAERPAFPPAFYNSRLNGLAAGDVTGDGALDLVGGGPSGELWFVRNTTLEERPMESQPSTLLDARKQIATRLLTVVPAGGKGVVGAKAELFDGESRLVSSAFLGSNIGVGNARPHRFYLATREPGPHRLVVTFADGKKIEKQVDLGEDSPRHQILEIERP